jgi:hypothetical protein
MKTIAFAFLFCQCFILSSFGQTNKNLDNSINKFRFMEGVWKGNGWVLNGDAKQFFKETETITTKLSGTVIQMEAFGVAVNDKKNIINDALGLILYNADKKEYELHIYQSDGSNIIANVQLKNINEMEWSVTISATLKIMYTIKVEGTKWFEAGFKSTDNGVSWKQNFEMTLLNSK